MRTTYFICTLATLASLAIVATAGATPAKKQSVDRTTDPVSAARGVSIVRVACAAVQADTQAPLIQCRNLEFNAIGRKKPTDKYCCSLETDFLGGSCSPDKGPERNP